MTQARLGALALLVPDYDAAILFFVSVMGFRLTADIDRGRKRWVTVEPPSGARTWCWPGPTGQSRGLRSANRLATGCFCFWKQTISRATMRG